jgi:hypothetical protein
LMLAVTREGIPVRVWVWPGNTNDMTVPQEVKDDMRGWRLGRVVTVLDRGFSNDEKVRYLTRAGGHWIAGERMRDGSPDAPAALSRPRSLPIGSRQPPSQGSPRRRRRRRFIVCHNPAEADRDKQTRATRSRASFRWGGGTLVMGTACTGWQPGGGQVPSSKMQTISDRGRAALGASRPRSRAARGRRRRPERQARCGVWEGGRAALAARRSGLLRLAS